MIKLNRVNSEIDFEEIYDVIIDDKIKIKVKNDQIIDYDLKNGDHTIYVKKDKFKSNKIKFNLDINEIVEFEIKPNHSNNVLAKILIFFLKNKAIKISIKEDIYL